MTEQERELTIIRRMKEFLALPDEARELVVEFMRAALALHDAGVTLEDLRAGRVALKAADA